MFETSLEAMQAQIQSKLGIELDACWQDLIDYRDGELNGMSYNQKLAALKSRFMNTTAKKLHDIVWKYVGINIAEIQFTSIYNSSFCTWMFFNKDGSDRWDGTFQIEKVLSGGYIDRCFPFMADFLNTDEFSADDLLMLAKSYNKKTGGINESAKLAVRKLVNSILGFDIEFAFLSKEAIVYGDYTNFTAQEITAIVLHEIGHTITLVEHAADTYARISSFNHVTESFKRVNGGKIEVAHELAHKVATILDKKGIKSYATSVRDVADKMKVDIETAGVSAKPTETRKSIEGFLSTIFNIIGDVITLPFDIAFDSAFSDRFASDKKVKLADIPLNERFVTWQERKADEYAFSNGYGAFQAAALHKLNQFYDRLGKSKKAVTKLDLIEKTHKTLSIWTKIGILATAPAMLNSYGYSLYPVGVKRFRELINLTVQQLKANSDNPAYVAKYIKDIDAMLPLISENSKDAFVAKAWKGYDLFLKYLSLPSFIDWIVNGRVQREIETLINDVNDIGNNLLAYYGTKFQLAASK